MTVHDRNRTFHRFLLLWGGQFLSGIGSGVSAFALGIDAFQKTGTVASFSLIIVSLYLPSTILKPIGGVLADRFNRKGLIIAGDLGGAVTVLALVMLMSSGAATAGPIAAIIAIGSVFAAIREPAYKAAVTDLLDPAQFIRAAGMMQFAAAGQHVLSPLAAGFLIALGTVQTVLIVDLATFCVAVIAASFLPAILPRGAKSDLAPLPNLRDGWSAIAGNRAVGIPVLLIAAVTLCVGYVQTLFPPMMLTRFTAATLGAVQSISATGMIASSIAIGLVSAGPGSSGAHLNRRLAGGLTAAGISIAAVGVAGSPVTIGIAFFLFFAALPLINTSADVLVRRNVETGRQGRVWGMIGFLTQTGYLVAYLTAAPLADKIFEPFVSGTGVLVGVLGLVIGTGPGRGIGLMIVVAGIALTGTALLAGVMLRGEPDPVDAPAAVDVKPDYAKETTL